MVSLLLAIYLAVDLFLLCVGFIQILRRESRAPQVLAITLLWPWIASRTILRIGLSLLRELATIAGKTLGEMRAMILER